MRNEHPELVPSIGEMAISGAEKIGGIFGSIGRWAKTILILIAVVLGLWLILKLIRK